MRRLRRTALLGLAALAAVEALGQAGYRLLAGRFIWRDPLGVEATFPVTPMVELVDDDRIVTLKAGYVSKCPVPQTCWRVTTDERRFREGLNRYSPARPSVVFLGDSVPFGWGLDGEDTVPSRFYEGLTAAERRREGVLNAAVPSYSLRQSQARYALEVDGALPVRAVVLQIYDPAAQFALWGRSWDETLAWLAADARAARAGGRLPALNWAYRRSFILTAARLLHLRLSRLDPADEAAFARFDRVNEARLEDFHRLLRARGIPLVLLPVNPAMPHVLAAQEPAHAKAVARLNAVLRAFAAARDGVYFEDIAADFEAARPRRGRLFRDSCCHLSAAGAREQARFLLARMRARRLL
jgi:hypothetical protein